jgi:glycosyltransferase involved in cell wall biosynthesis
MKASIYIITHNHEQWIADAIDGALAQVTDFDFEIVIGEDCSTDATMQIVQQYQQKHADKIRVITSRENVGARANMIRTINACKGEYLAHIDGDDFWNDSHKLADQVAFLESHKDFSCSASQARIEYHGTLDKRFESNYARTQEQWSGDDVVKTPSFCATSSMVYRKADLLPLPAWFDDVAWGDSSMRGILAAKGKFHYLQRKATTYRCNNWGMLHKLRCQGKAFMSKSAQQILDCIAEHHKQLSTS